MLSDRIGDLLKVARQERGLTRAQLARRGGVSARLVAELERGQRPNVSLESALKLLKIVGVSVMAKAPNGAAAEIRSGSAAALQRAARAALRRQTWTGRQIFLRDEGDDPRPPRSKSKRLASVANISRDAYSMASSGHTVREAPTKRQSRR